MSVNFYGAPVNKQIEKLDNLKIKRFNTKEKHVTDLIDLINKQQTDTAVIEAGGMFNIFNHKFDVVHNFVDQHVESINEIISEIEKMNQEHKETGTLASNDMENLQTNLKTLARNLLRTRQFIGQTEKHEASVEETEAKNLYETFTENNPVAPNPNKPPLRANYLAEEVEGVDNDNDHNEKLLRTNSAGF